MSIQVSFSLFPGQMEKYLSFVDKEMKSTVLRNYLLYHYRLPDDLSILQLYEVKRGTKPKPVKFIFNNEANERLNHLVKIVKEDELPCNRSLIIRHLIDDLINRLNNKQIKITELYTKSKSESKRKMALPVVLEKKINYTLDLLTQYKERNTVIEDFILEKYIPSPIEVLQEKPKNPEILNIYISEKAFHLLDYYVGKKGVSRSAIMRDVVNQLIDFISDESQSKKIDDLLNNALEKYRKAYGNTKLKNKLLNYLNNL